MGRKRKVRGLQKGKAISPKQKEQMLQLYSVEGNYTEVARLMRLSVGCVTKHIKAALREPDPEIVAARQRTARELAGKTHYTATRIIDSIGDHDIESGSIKVNHPETGELQRIITYGPSLMQKVTAAAILTDKLRVLADYEAALGGEQSEGRLLMPQDVAGLISGIRSKVKSLSVFNVQFENDNPDLSQRVQQKLEEAEAIEVEAKEITVDDFDGNE